VTCDLDRYDIPEFFEDHGSRFLKGVCFLKRLFGMREGRFGGILRRKTLNSSKLYGKNRNPALVSI
jgi:hypothetical protein